jgi:hypothetical protein
MRGLIPAVLLSIVLALLGATLDTRGLTKKVSVIVTRMANMHNTWKASEALQKLVVDSHIPPEFSRLVETGGVVSTGDLGLSCLSCGHLQISDELVCRLCGVSCALVSKVDTPGTGFGEAWSAAFSELRPTLQGCSEAACLQLFVICGSARSCNRWDGQGRKHT